MQKKSYVKVNEYIWDKVSKGELKLGDKLPPEREFAKILNISRSSAREGLRVLENVGVISSQQGAGNFISAEFEEILVEIMSFMYTLNGMKDNQITEFRYALEWEVINLITGKIPDEIKERLLYYLERLEKAENEDEAVLCDKNIHYLLIEATNNDYMKTNYKALTKIMNIYIPRLRGKIIVGMKGDQELSKAHRMIVEGVIEGNKEKSMKGLKLHFKYMITYQNS